MNAAPGWHVTGAALLQFFAALVWAGLVFLAIAGYGGALLRVFGMRVRSLVLMSVAGFGPVILLGGLLNLAHGITRGLLTGMIGLGAGLFCAAWVWSTPEASAAEPAKTGAAARAAWVLVAIVFALRLASTVQNPVYLDSDDLEYYLAAPVKMLEQHALTPEPYSERRVMSSVGGNYFLETVMLAERPLENMQMADWSVGCVLLLLLAYGIGQEMELTALQSSVFAFLLLITPQTRLNLTFVILPSALFLGLVYLSVHRRLTQRHPWLQAVLLGGTVAAIASMKSTFVTHGVLFVLCLAVLRWRTRGFRPGVRLAVVAALACFAVLLPWMVADHADVGTWFYPLLGKGTHYSAYGLYPPPTNLSAQILLKKVLPFCLPILVLAGLEFAFAEREERSWAIATYTVAVFFATYLTGAATGGDSVRRYNYPAVLPAITLAWVVFARRADVAELLARGGERLARPRLWQGAAVLAGLLAAAVGIDNGLSSFTIEYKHMLWQLEASLSEYHIVPESKTDRYAAMEKAIPPGATVLESVDFPFLLNYGTHTIYMADVPGAASPKPGWPARAGGDALAQFLLAHGVRYLAYSYNECPFKPPYHSCMEETAALEKENAGKAAPSQWIASEGKIGRDAKQQYELLEQTRKHVYDDGGIVVLDLAAPAKS